MEYPINVVVDIGGAGARLALSTRSGLKDIRHEHPNSVQELLDCIRNLTNGRGPDALAMAVPCWVRDKQVVHCHTARWLEGNPAETIRRELLLNNEKIHIIHDGEAHALALKKHPRVRFGAIHFAVGSGVGFGVLGENGEVLRSLSGDNWELNDVRLVTSAHEKEMWRLLGSDGFEEQKNRTDTDGYNYYGWRLGSFACQLSLIFRPRVIGLSGGIIHHCWGRIKGGFFDELDKRLGHLRHVMPKPDVIVLDDKYAALTGLTSLF